MLAMFVSIDPLYLILVGPAFLLAMLSQLFVKGAFSSGMKKPVRSGMSGVQAARAILDANGMHDVGIEQSQGTLSDHYDPKDRVLRLSPDVYNGRTCASVGVAAHEAGHALQHALGYAPLSIRNSLVPIASLGSQSSMGLFVIGMVISAFRVLPEPIGQYMMIGGIILFSAVVFFQLVNLPVEFNASSRAIVQLENIGIIQSDEVGTVRKVLAAAALTYVAVTLQSVMTLIYFMYRAGLLGGNRQD